MKNLDDVETSLNANSEEAQNIAKNDPDPEIFPIIEYDFETLGGLILHLAGDIPSPGDEVEHEGLLFRVEGVEDNRILGVRVERLPEPETPEA